MDTDTSPCLNQKGKHELVAHYAEPYGLLVETGLWNGGGASTTLAEQGYRCFAIDTNLENVRSAQDRGVDVQMGDSAIMLPLLLASRVYMPACFWLDAHYAVEEREHLEANPCPLLAELAAILDWPHAARSTVLVDDLRLLGSPGWPTRSDVADLDLGLVWAVEERDDILRLTPFEKEARS